MKVASAEGKEESAWQEVNTWGKEGEDEENLWFHSAGRFYQAVIKWQWGSLERRDSTLLAFSADDIIHNRNRAAGALRILLRVCVI